MTDYQIPTPCSAPWDQMVPVDGGRHCDHCDKVVVDFCHADAQELTRALDEIRAESGVQADGRLGVCIRARQSSLRPSRRGGHVLTGGMALMLACGAAGCGQELAIEPPALAGEVAICPSVPPPTCQNEQPAVQDIHYKGYKISAILVESGGTEYAVVHPRFRFSEPERFADRDSARAWIDKVAAALSQPSVSPEKLDMLAPQ